MANTCRHWIPRISSAVRAKLPRSFTCVITQTRDAPALSHDFPFASEENNKNHDANFLFSKLLIYFLDRVIFYRMFFSRSRIIFRYLVMHDHGLPDTPGCNFNSMRQFDQFHPFDVQG